MDKYTWSATAAFSLEGVVGGELKRMGFEDVTVRDGRAFFTGTAQDALEANLRLRTADRVYMEMRRFRAMSFEELFEGVRAIPWERILPRDANIPVTGKCARSQLMSVRDSQAITKKAIVERLKKAYGLEWLPEDGPKYAVDVHIHKDEAALCVDSSGAGLSRRGYRTWNGEAPLRETIAAAMLLLSPWRAELGLLDPLCGTGTIVIEAAFIAMNRAPGIGRSFDLEEWKGFDKDAATAVRERLRAQEHAPQRELFGSDIDGEALVLAQRHAKAAGVDKFVTFRECDIGRIDHADVALIDAVVTNPPYGERLGDRKEAENIYRLLRALKRGMPCASLTTLTAHPGFERAYGRRADKKRRLFNGRLECELYIYQGQK